VNNKNKVILGIIGFALFLILVSLIAEVAINNFRPTLFPYWGRIAGFTVTESMPDHALVIVYHGEYYPLLDDYIHETINLNQPVDSLIKKEDIYRAGNARNIYEPNSIAINRADFQGTSEFIVTYILRSLGVLPELKSRWDNDGIWNW